VATTLDDIAARLDRLESVLMQAGLLRSVQEPVLNELELIKRKALILARQGKRQESIELMRSISGRRAVA